MNDKDKKTDSSAQSRRKTLHLKTSENDRLSVQTHDVAKNHIVEVRCLLSELVNTAAAVLTSRPVHVWQVYGGFQRIYEAVLRIFYHGCMHKDSQGMVDIWPFIIGLRVLSPVLGPSSEVATVPKPGDKWVLSSLQKLQLAAKIEALTADKEHVEKHYHNWALFRSHPHISAVKTCLKALEENSQDGLANIDPKLLVGDYFPPPGTPPVHGPPDAAERLLKLKTNLIDSGINKIPLDPVVSCQRSTLSLPTSPITDRNWVPSWPHAKQNLSSNRPKSEIHQISASHETANSNYCDRVEHTASHRALKESQHIPIRRGKSEASIQITSRKSSGWTDRMERSGSSSLMCRESPDGSSGSSDWPLTSPVGLPVPFVQKDSPQISSSSSSPIARLVKGELVRSETGTRPKEPSGGILLKNPCVPHHLDVSDSSEAGGTISPSLLQVNYGETDTPHSTAKLSSSDVSLPQLRRRLSGGRLTSGRTDSDQDSEETVDGAHVQGSRRRKKGNVSQHRSGLSVKLLVDCRGVLGSEPDNSNSSTPKNLRKNLMKSQSSASIDTRDSGVETEKINSQFGAGRSKYLKVPSQHNQGCIENPEKTDSISTPTKASDDKTSLLASSAPGTAMKSSLSPFSGGKAKKKTHSRSRSDGSQEIVGKLKLASSNTAPTLETTMKLGDEATYGSQIRKRFMDDGGHSITPAADYGVSPRPQPGQSLIGFLSSKDKPYAELDRENAHFNISEAVIAALTQMQFDVWRGKTEPDPCTGDDSDEEIRILEARIREKRRLKQTVKSSSVSTDSSNPQQWARNQPSKVESTTDYSMYESPQSSTYNSDSDPSDLDDDSENPSSKADTPVCLSRKTSSTDQPSGMGDLLSAEGVAINLLKRFSEQKLPKASELDWLVSEQDVPQKLLPLPTSVAISPDDAGTDKEAELQLQLRGTMDWAPPRPQLILTLHTNTKRSVLMGLQRWRCAGCGMRVSESLSRHFRLCSYLGRYFCTTCHRNQTAIIPAKVLHKWDFKLYPVASFSKELIERMRIDPLINVGALNPRLYRKCRHLHQTHIYRLQLYHTLPYINTCSRAHNEKLTLGKLPLHWASDPHVYSLDDLDCIRNGQLVDSIKDVTMLCIRHISKCEVCLGRGFICEVCCRGEAIFPFQLDSTSLCEICSACFHAGCFSPNRCPRCIRRESRRLSHDLITDDCLDKES